MRWLPVVMLLASCGKGGDDDDKQSDSDSEAAGPVCDPLTPCENANEICVRYQDADGKQLNAAICLPPLDECGGVHEDYNCQLDNQCAKAWSLICKQEGGFVWGCQTDADLGAPSVTCQVD